MRKLLLAVDESAQAMRATDMAALLSRTMDAKVDVVHVVDHAGLHRSEAVEEFERVEHVTLSGDDVARLKARDVLDTACSRLQDGGGTLGERVVLVGSPGSRIVEYADATGADVIISGRRGLGDAVALLVGSVSHKVEHLTDRPVVTTG